MYSRVMARAPPSRRFWRVSRDRPETKSCSMSASSGRSGRKVIGKPATGSNDSGRGSGIVRLSLDAEEAADARQQGFLDFGHRGGLEGGAYLLQAAAARADDPGHLLRGPGAGPQPG